MAAFPTPIGAPHPIEEIILTPAGKGMYEIYLNDRRIYSKKETGKHIADEDVVELIRRAET